MVQLKRIEENRRKTESARIEETQCHTTLDEHRKANV